jgi:hypothetical protein
LGFGHGSGVDGPVRLFVVAPNVGFQPINPTVVQFRREFISQFIPSNLFVRLQFQ